MPSIVNESNRLLAVGLDIGTKGVKALAVTLAGHVVAIGRAAFPAASQHSHGVITEQDPQAWHDAAAAALRAMMINVPANSRIIGIAVDATSGTFLLTDADYRPLSPGIMYNDLRATAQTSRAADCLRETLQPYGIEIAPAFALPKIIHLAATQPDVRKHCRHVVHQTDWIVGMLCGQYDVTDVSTALKTGVNPGQLAWPTQIASDLNIPLEWLPRVVLPGEPIGRVTPTAAAATGLPAGTPVVAGCTDGTAGFLASGAAVPGDLNVTLGTTLVFKAVAQRPLVDPSSAVYNHRHPAGGFLPGAASSTGGEWVNKHFANIDLDTLGRAAAQCLPTRRLVYPLVPTGERFPFASAIAHGFGLDDDMPPAERFAAGMEGTAFLERMGAERFEALGLPLGPTVYATGGAVAGDTWLRIRASVMQREYAVPEQPECAVGAAVLSAAGYCGDFAKAARSIVRIGRRIPPDAKLAEAYGSAYLRFKDELCKRGYL